MLQAFLLFAICCVVFIGVSLVTPKPRPEQIKDLCWDNPLSALLAVPERGGLGDPRVLALALGVIMIALYVSFR
jgi:hypothetical protein